MNGSADTNASGGPSPTSPIPPDNGGRLLDRTRDELLQVMSRKVNELCDESPRVERKLNIGLIGLVLTALGMIGGMAGVYYGVKEDLTVSIRVVEKENQYQGKQIDTLSTDMKNLTSSLNAINQGIGRIEGRLEGK